MRRGRFAVGVLVVLCVAAGTWLATSTRVRLKWWALRMRSSDCDVARSTRLAVWTCDDPAADELRGEILVENVEETIASAGSAAVVAVYRVPRSSWGGGPFRSPVETLIGPSVTTLDFLLQLKTKDERLALTSSRESDHFFLVAGLVNDGSLILRKAHLLRHLDDPALVHLRRVLRR